VATQAEHSFREILEGRSEQMLNRPSCTRCVLRGQPCLSVEDALRPAEAAINERDNPVARS
jgi:hypothetical protein